MTKKLLFSSKLINKIYDNTMPVESIHTVKGKTQRVFFGEDFISSVTKESTVQNGGNDKVNTGDKSLLRKRYRKSPARRPSK